VLGSALAQTKRSIKSALLDQAVLAGVGNIYADEALHMAGIHPARRADGLRADEIANLAQSIAGVLAAAIAAGGSTLRDYADANGRPGSYQTAHAVYGRAGQPCLTCGTLLASRLLAQRTTVWCPHCQPARTAVRFRSYAHLCSVATRS